MTREEALLKLHEYMRFIHGTISDKYYGEALRMAVSALQQPDVADINVGDTISRQAAIETSLEFFVEFLGGAFYENSQKELIARFQRLPSAQPVARDIDVLSNDLISRQEAIDQLHQSYNLLDAERRLEDMPPVTPKQQWIPVTLETLPYTGSVVVVCGEKGTWDYGMYRGWHGDIHSWWWKKNSIKHVYWWMYKDDAMSLPYRKEGGE